MGLREVWTGFSHNHNLSDQKAYSSLSNDTRLKHTYHSARHHKRYNPHPKIDS
ncbi:asl8533 (plasmid) [Nostoc sp. PCC 7120 = FACHB-418]|nr:asl8533 [Nostoc sp. PCC 7120 = FACHB-418]